MFFFAISCVSSNPIKTRSVVIRIHFFDFFKETPSIVALSDDTVNPLDNELAIRMLYSENVTDVKISSYTQSHCYISQTFKNYFAFISYEPRYFYQQEKCEKHHHPPLFLVEHIPYHYHFLWLKKQRQQQRVYFPPFLHLCFYSLFFPFFFFFVFFMYLMKIIISIIIIMRALKQNIKLLQLRETFLFRFYAFTSIYVSRRVYEGSQSLPTLG